VTSEQARTGLLRHVEDITGRLPDEWRTAIMSVPRDRFLPDVIWMRRPGERAIERCDRRASPADWLAAAYRDVAVIVQVRDGAEVGPGETAWPSSSASQPSIVAGMLLTLDVIDGHRVLEIGTGSGWNAGLLAHRLGSDAVVTVEVDAALADAARSRLAGLDLHPLVVTGDGAEGWIAEAPYDRIICTCSVERVPAPWIEQTRGGGLIVTPWATSWTADGTLVLTAAGDGITATGRFEPGGAFMRMRGHRSRVTDVDDVFDAGHDPDVGVTSVSPWDVAGDADFAIGVTVPGVWHHWETAPIAGVHTRMWVGDEAGTSWAAVDYDGRQLDTFTVLQHGPRRLWDDISAAWTWWESAGRPGLESFGLTVDMDGHQRVWCGSPAGPSWPIPSG